MDAGEHLNLFANLGIGGKIAGLDVAPAETLGRLAFGGEILGFYALIHEPGGFQSDGRNEAWHPTFP